MQKDDLDDDIDGELDIEPYLESFLDDFQKFVDDADDDNDYLSVVMSIFVLKEIVVEKFLRANHSKEEVKDMVRDFNKMARDLVKEESEAPIDISKLN